MFTIEAYCSLTLLMTTSGKFQIGKNDNISQAEFFLHRRRFPISYLFEKQLDFNITLLFGGYELLSEQPKMHEPEFKWITFVSAVAVTDIVAVFFFFKKNVIF